MEVTRIVIAVFLAFALAAPAAANGRLVALGAPFEVRYQRVEVEVSERHAITRVRQQFTNHTANVMEGEYSFQLAPGATVSDFAIWDGDTRVAGVVRRREDARAIYEHFLPLKRDPGLLEQVGPSMFSARVFPIPGQSDKRIEIEYREALPVDDGIACYRYPLGDATPNGPLKEFVLTMDVRDGAEIGSAWSHTPGVAVHHHDAHRVTISYEAVAPAPQDLIVYYTVRAASGLSVAAHRTTSDAGYVALTISPPPDRAPRRARDIVFVVDTSGSMKGEKIEQAKRALTQALTSLEPGDRFDLIHFSTGVEPMSGTLVPLDRASLERAERWTRALVAAGGTNIQDALAAALAVFPDDASAGRARYVVFLTDGQPSVGERDTTRIIEEAARANRARARVFTFGIGDAQGAQWLAALSAQNRGESLAMSAYQDLSTELPRFVRKLTLPLFENAKLEWKGAAVTGVHPRDLPPFYLGRQLTVVGRYPVPGKASVRFTADVDGKPVTLESEVALPREERGSAFIPRLWAQQEVDGLLARPEVPEEEVVRLSVLHRFVTPFTSFIAVPEAEKNVLPPELRKKLDETPQLAVEDPARDSAEPRLPAGMSKAEYHFQLALAWDRSGRPDAARKAFKHVREAVRLDPAYKRRFQESFKESEVYRRIQSIPSEIIEKSENDQLTDAETQKYAEKFRQMLGQPLDRPVTRGGPPRANTSAPRFVDPNRDAGRVQAFRWGFDTAPAHTASAPPPDPLAGRWRDLQRQAIAARDAIARMRARLENMKRLAAGKPAAQLAPWIEAVTVQNAVVPGGARVPLAIRVRHPAGQAPRVRWTAPEGLITDVHGTTAAWIAPMAPGLHTITVELWTPAGERFTRAIEVMVYQPGSITFAPPFLDGRLAELDAALQALRAELKNLTAELDGVLPGLSEARVQELDGMPGLP
jgi:Ca-activated chloride channel family protein